jgi:hypothetical protein
METIYTTSVLGPLSEVKASMALTTIKDPLSSPSSRKCYQFYEKWRVEEIS